MFFVLFPYKTVEVIFFVMFPYKEKCRSYILCIVSVQRKLLKGEMFFFFFAKKKKKY